MSSFAPFIAPIVTAIASVFFPPLLGLEGILAPAALGAGLGAGGSLLGSAITGQWVKPENVLIGAATGGVGGALGGMGGFSGLADSLGLGASGAGAASGGIAETAGAAATEAAASAAPMATAAPAGAGGTAASMAGTIDPVYGSTVVGGSPALGPSSSVPTSAYFAAPSAPSPLASIGSKGLDVLSKVGQTVGLGQMAASVLGGGQQPSAGGLGGGMGTRYTTGQGGQYSPYTFEGALGTAPTPGYLDPAGRFISDKQRQGSLGSLATSVLG